MHLSDLKKIHDDLFATSHGYDSSRAGRAQLSIDDKAFTYGEIDFTDFARILESVPLQGKKVFYDLGAGVGKVVMAMALLANFDRLYGIELLEPVVKESKKILADFNTRYRSALPPPQSEAIINFIHDDILDFNYRDADVVFFQATCFNESLMLALTKKLENLKIGNTVITVTKPITSPLYGVLHADDYHMAWGNATVFVHKKYY